MKVTRPEPTIYGNCDSWSFIVGKTRRAYTLGVSRTRPLQVRNSQLVHSFSTISGDTCKDNMWATCGWLRGLVLPSRMVVTKPCDMPWKASGWAGF